jgi:hypothetical protein
MQGVQILNEFMHEGAVAMPWFGISLGCCITGMVGAFLLFMFYEIPRKIRSCAVAILIGIVLFGAGVGAFAPREVIPRYQVIIDDEVEFNDFISKYKIIKQEGLIYTVEELNYNE